MEEQRSEQVTCKRDYLTREDILKRLQQLKHMEVQVLIGTGMTRTSEMLLWDEHRQVWGLKWNGGMSQLWFSDLGVHLIKDDMIFVDSKYIA